MYALLGLVLVGLRVVLQLSLNNSSHVTATHVVYFDTAAYGTALSMHDHPELFARDPLFGNSRFADAMWSSSYLYLSALRSLMSYTEGDWVFAYQLYPLACFLVMFLFVWYASSFLIKEPLARLAMAFLATLPGGFAVTSSTWGVPVSPFRGMEMTYQPTPVIPETIFNVFSPLLVVALLIATTNHTQRGNMRSAAWLVVCGCLAGSTLFWAHSVSAVAFIQLASLVLLILGVKKQLPLSSVFYFVMGALGFVLVRMAYSEGVGWELDDIGARIVMNAGRGCMVFPWGALNVEGTCTAIGLATYIPLTLWLLWKFTLDARPNKRVDVSLIMLQGLYCCLAMRFGGVPVLVASYYAIKGYRGRLAIEERTLLVALCAANVLGPPQQFIFSLLWDTGWLNPLTGVIYEMARFQNFAMPILMLLVVRAAWQLSERAGPAPLRAFSFLTLVGLCATMLLTLHPVCDVASGVTLIFLGRLLINTQEGCSDSPTNRRAATRPILIAGAMSIVIFGMGFGELTQRQYFSVTSILHTLALKGFLDTGGKVDASEYRFEPGYREQIDKSFLEVTLWAKRNTPTDALFHLRTRDSAFRPLAQRALLVGLTDVSAGAYGGPIVHELLRLSAYTDIHRPPEGQLCILSDVGTDYFVTLKEERVVPCLRQGSVVVADLVFKNQVYAIYKITKSTASVSTSLPQPE
jgi:hypothetical protein